MKSLFFGFGLILCSASAFPQESAQVGSESAGLDGYWQAFAGGGHYMVKLDSIASVSKHSFIMDGVSRVVEVTLATNSAVTARFYSMTPLSAGAGALAMPQQALSRAQEAATVASQRAGAIDPNMAKTNVVKNYPTTTHAHTVDYLLPSEELVNSLYNSLTHAWADQRHGVSWSER